MLEELAIKAMAAACCKRGIPWNWRFAIFRRLTLAGFDRDAILRHLPEVQAEMKRRQLDGEN